MVGIETAMSRPRGRDCAPNFLSTWSFSSPLTNLTSFTPSGQPQNPAYVPTNVDIYNDKMTLTERVKNAFSLFCMQVAYHYFFLPREQALAEVHFGPGLPPLAEIAKNTSLLLANVHFSLNLPRPVVPQMVEVGGIHIQPPRPLPKVSCLK